MKFYDNGREIIIVEDAYGCGERVSRLESEEINRGWKAQQDKKAKKKKTEAKVITVLLMAVWLAWTVSFFMYDIVQEYTLYFWLTMLVIGIGYLVYLAVLETIEDEN